MRTKLIRDKAKGKAFKKSRDSERKNQPTQSVLVFRLPRQKCSK